MPQQKATNGSNELDGLDGMGKALLYLDRGLRREACGYDSKMTAALAWRGAKHAGIFWWLFFL